MTNLNHGAHCNPLTNINFITELKMAACLKLGTIFFSVAAEKGNDPFEGEAQALCTTSETGAD